MAIPLSEQLENLRTTLLDLEIRVNRGNGLEPLVPYEKLHRILHDYNDVLGSLLKDFDTRLKALEQKGGARAK